MPDGPTSSINLNHIKNETVKSWFALPFQVCFFRFFVSLFADLSHKVRKANAEKMLEARFRAARVWVDSLVNCRKSSSSFRLGCARDSLAAENLFLRGEFQRHVTSINKSLWIYEAEYVLLALKRYHHHLKVGRVELKACLLPFVSPSRFHC